jgi:hypothetical protein
MPFKIATYQVDEHTYAQFEMSGLLISGQRALDKCLAKWGCCSSCGGSGEGGTRKIKEARSDEINLKSGITVTDPFSAVKQ